MRRVFAGRQLPLEFGGEIVDFQHFIQGMNTEIYTVTRSIALGESRHNLYIWGAKATGKSYLLQAACGLAASKGLNAVYIPLRHCHDSGPDPGLDVFAGLERSDLVCIDDVYHIAGLEQWEKALFYLYNYLGEQRTALLMTGIQGAFKKMFRLPDLNSRISSCLSYQLHPLGDEDKINLLRKKANMRCFDLPNGVANYVIKNVRRDLPTLLALLDKIDRATLSDRRRLTVPFVKSLIQEEWSTI